MAVIKLQKVHLIGMQEDKAKVLKALQDFEMMQMTEIDLGEENTYWQKKN